MRRKHESLYEIIQGKVVTGNKIGRTISFPTANLKFDNTSIDIGTYRINGIIDNKIYKGAGVFLGTNNIFEAHFIDFEGNLYGKIIKVIIFYKIRDNLKIKCLDDLKNEIQKDLHYVKENPDHILTFGTFDTFHLGHQFYLENAKMYGDKLVTVIAKSKNVEKFKSHKPDLSEKNRLNSVRDVGISDIVHIGDTKNPLKWLDLYYPRVICLGYDQEGFVDSLRKYREDNNLNIKIIRIPAFEEKIFKSSLLKKDIDNN